MTRTELVNAVGDGHAGALNIALHLSDEMLQKCLERGWTGSKLWTRGTLAGLFDPFTGEIPK